MKIYQLIFTCAEHSLSDSELGIKNEAGMGVYSCSQGLTRENINEIKRFCKYNLYEDADLSGAKTPRDTNIPDRFPKVFRTFRLTDGKMVALQSVYSGLSYDGQQGNFFTHALIADEKDSIIPERYYRSKTFKKYLSDAEMDRELVTYLPVLESADSSRNLTKNVESFIEQKKVQMTVLLEKLAIILSGGEKKHLVVAASNQQDADMYLISLKYVLPKEISVSIGISTYNVYMPSNAQSQIRIHGTIKGKNSITEQDITEHTNCIYVDTDKISGDRVNRLFNMKLRDIYKEYEAYNVHTADEFIGYMDLGEMDNTAELSEKLADVKKRLGSDVFKKQSIEIFDSIDDSKYDAIRFEILDLMCGCLDLFDERKEQIAEKYIEYGIKSISSGNSVNIEKIFKESFSDEFKKKIAANIPVYMNITANGTIDKKNGMLLLRIFSMLKAFTGKKYWKDFFMDSDEYMKQFVKISADVIINDTVPVTFTPPQVWTKSDLSETVAYIEASYSDPAIKNGCRKYILSNSSEEWSRFGILLKTTKKSTAESVADVKKIREILSRVGYVPLSKKRSYGDIKSEITNEINNNDNPLMVAQLLSSVYTWQGLEGQLNESKLAAEKVYDHIMELKENERSCYDYVFPKLGIEILNSPGHYHEVIINADTMEPEFWNWFLIAYYKIRHDENKRIVYSHVYEASSRYLKNVPIKERLDRIFLDKEEY